MLDWNNKASLIIKDTEQSDSSRYRCEINNALGRVESTGTLAVYGQFNILIVILRIKNDRQNIENI